MKVSELKGTKSLRAFNAYQTLLLGVKMLPAFSEETFEDFYARMEALDPSNQERIIREAAFFVQLDKEEVEAMLSFCSDANGVAYSPANIKNLSTVQIIDGIVAVSMEFARMKVNLVPEHRKKNSETSQ